MNNNNLTDILSKPTLSRKEILYLLKLETDEDKKLLFRRAYEIKEKYIGRKVYYRGLIEFSNICHKDCLYCGIRRSNKNVQRYELTDKEVIDAAKYVAENKFGSLVIQAGERSSKDFTKRITRLISEIKEISDGKIGITLSLGEQKEETYSEWFEAGAHRYLLRIEEADPELYKKLHPNNKLHDYQVRLEALKLIKKIGFQVGTGVMIGLPFQSIENLADDLLFFKNFDVDMVGMGPYIEHHNTPLYEFKESLIPQKSRLALSLKMIAILRIMMKDINIASTTALQAIDPMGREKGLQCGANIIMPNITPGKYRENYLLYEDKPCTDENPDDCTDCLEKRIHFAGDDVGYDEWGDSQHFKNRQSDDYIINANQELKIKPIKAPAIFPNI